MLESLAVYLAAVSGGHKCVYPVLLQEFKQASVLVLGEQGLDFDLRRARVTASDVIEGAAADKILDNETPYPVRLRGYDADSLAPVETAHEVVYRKSVEPGAYDADDNHPERIVRDEEGRKTHDQSGEGDAGAYVYMEELADYHRNYVKSSGGGIDAEEEGLRGAEHQHETAQVEPGVSHHAGLAGRY